LTAERFVPDPWQVGGRLYRTGDVVRVRGDGSLEYLGRRDEQIKLRGYRIELGEIESLVRQQPEVREVLVQLWEEAGRDGRLVAYVIWQPQWVGAGEVQLWEQVRRRLEQQLPAYMVPAAQVSLVQFPMTPNGKVDRRALPAPQESAEGADSYVPVRSTLEELLAGIWAEVLGREQVGLDANFFTLGGHSLLAMQLVSRVRRVLGVELELKRLFLAPTLRQQAKQIEQTLSQHQLHELSPLLPLEQRTQAPLSFAQQRLWFLSQLEPQSAAYNIPGALRLRGALNLPAFTRALEELLNRHEALRTTFQIRNEQPVQIIASELHLVLPVIDLSATAPEQREAKALALIKEIVQQPFDLTTGPLICFHLLRLQAQEHILLINMHHIISDGWSLDIMIHEHASLYNSFCADRPSSLPPLPFHYADYAVWQRRWLQGEVLQKQLHYWQQQLAHAPQQVTLPLDRPRPPVQSYRGANAGKTLPTRDFQILKKLCGTEGVTLFMLLLAAFQTVLYRVTGQEDIVVGSPIANRTRSEVEHIVGFFVNTLVLRTNLAGNPTFRALLKQVRALMLDAYANQDLPFEQLVQMLRVERNISYSPLFQIMFVLQNTPWSMPVFAGLEVELFAQENATSKFDVALTITQKDNELFVGCNYNTDLFNESSIVRLLDDYHALLMILATDPDQHIQDAILLAESEHQGVLPMTTRVSSEARFSSESLLSALRDFLQKRLPDYMVPALFMVLEALPLTANGKRDLAALPSPAFPRSEGNEQVVAPRNALELGLAHIWEELLDIRPIGVKENFFALGGHSLLAIRLMTRIQKVYHIDVPLNIFFQHPTVEELAQILRQEIVQGESSSLIVFQKEGKKQPFFCIHPGGGNVFCYAELASALGNDRPFYALQAIGLEADIPAYSTIEEMAAHYLQEIMLIQPQGPYLLGGWSMGGIIAFEMARQLLNQKQEVGMVALIDSWIPNPDYLAQPAFRRLDEEQLLESFALDLVGLVGGNGQFLPVAEFRRLPSLEQRLQFLVDQGRQAGILPADTGLTQLNRLFKVFKANTQALFSYVPQKASTPLTLFRAEDHVENEQASDILPWEQLTTGTLDRYIIPGAHHTILKYPSVQKVAEYLRACLDACQPAESIQ
jgi:thioesterase domain-containing protein/acyl carrier protein